VGTNRRATLSSPSFDDIRAAQVRIGPYVHRTPVFQSSTLNTLSNATLLFKCENFQKGGAFKARGAYNAVLALSGEEAERGVVTHSSGNHGTALAMAARSRGIAAYVVVPENAIQIKIDSIRRLGAHVVTCGPTLIDREMAAAEIISRTEANPIHSYDCATVVAGQGTAAVELLEDKPYLDVIIVPIGGGGLIGGTAVAAKALKPTIMVIGAEPEMADDAIRSFREGRLISQNHPQTVADGLRTPLSPLTFALITKYVDDIVSVTEAGIINAMWLIWSILKIVVEPSAAVPLAAILSDTSNPLFARKRIGIILSGGNVDLQRMRCPAL
jgi:threonine dehydratase